MGCGFVYSRNCQAVLDKAAMFHYNNLAIGVWRSLVSRLVRVQEASGSNPDTPTIENSIANGCFAVLFLYLRVFSKLFCKFRFWPFFGKIPKSKQKGKQWPIFWPKNSLQEAQKNRPAIAGRLSRKEKLTLCRLHYMKIF